MRRMTLKVAWLQLWLACRYLNGALSFAPTTFLSKHPSAVATTTRRSISPLRSSSTSPQLLEFTEPTTNVTVVLVGAMHYNPTSIQLANETIRNLGKQDKLGSVVIETCKVRWNNSNEQDELLQEVLQNEMRTASHAAIDFGRPVVLGDELINVTVANIKSAFVETIQDLVLFRWSGLQQTLQQDAIVALPTGSGYLNTWSFFDSKLLLNAPFSLLKYPLSYLVKSPVVTLCLFTLVLLGPQQQEPTTLSLLDLTESALFAMLEIVVFARVFVSVLLAQRNQVLAKNILKQCKVYGKKQQPRPWWRQIWKNPTQNKLDEDETTGIVLSPPTTSSPLQQLNLRNEDQEENNKVVVAVLGMAHCNGIKKLLTEELVI